MQPRQSHYISQNAAIGPSSCRGTDWRKFKGQHDYGRRDWEPLRGKSASQRVSERTSENLWKVSKNLWKSLKTSENPWKPLKTSKDLWKSPLKTLPLRGPLRDPLRGRFPSQRLSVLLPLFCCPLNSLRADPWALSWGLCEWFCTQVPFETLGLRYWFP